MFCKFCGNQVDRRTMTCTACGKAVGSLEGGIGFWDLAGGAAGVSASADPIPKPDVKKEIPAMDRQNSKPRHRKGVPAWITAAAVIICLIACVVNIFCVLYVMKANAQIQNIIVQQQGNPDMQIEQGNSDAQAEQTASTEVPEEAATHPKTPPTEETSAPTEVPSTAPVNIEIVKQPSDEKITTKAGIDPAKPKILFILRALGNSLSFQWQKYNVETKVWENVDPENYQVISSLTERGYYESILYLKVLNAEAYSSYRCVITDENGDQIASDLVILQQYVVDAKKEDVSEQPTQPQTPSDDIQNVDDTQNMDETPDNGQVQNGEETLND